MAPIIPPCTGTGGIASSLHANLCDYSGNFRGRLGSGTKRSRTEAWGRREDDDMQARFDLTRSYPPLVVPPPPSVDVPAIKALMVEAAKSATVTKALLADKKASAPNKLLAGSIMALYSLVEALLEKALLPLAEHAKSPPFPANAPPPTPAEPADVLELRGALERADRTSIFFGANLGEASIANRNALAHNLNIGIRNTIISKAGDNATAAAESVRVAADALSCSTNVEFLGAAS